MLAGYASYDRRMRGRLRLGVGALGERDYRLLFTATAITAIGDRLAVIALAFAVLDLGGATDLGIVLAARQSSRWSTRWGAGAFELACCLAVLALPSVWGIRAGRKAPALA